jgi:hypothetical protein
VGRGEFRNVVGLDCDLRRDWVNGSWQTSASYRRTKQKRHRCKMNEIFALFTTFSNRLPTMNRLQCTESRDPACWRLHQRPRESGPHALTDGPLSTIQPQLLPRITGQQRQHNSRRLLHDDTTTNRRIFLPQETRRTTSLTAATLPRWGPRGHHNDFLYAKVAASAMRVY